MFNLITSIIAVALTAALAAAEITYVGPAFLSSGPKAVAAQIVSAMSQINGAWTMWGTSTASTTAIPTMTGTGLVTDLLGVAGSAGTQFLTSVPPAPAGATTWGGIAGSKKYMLDLYTTAASTGVDVDLVGVYVVLDSTSLSTCTEIARAGGQITPTGTLAAPGSGLTLTVTAPGLVAGQFDAAFVGYKYGCVAIGGAGAALISLNNVPSVAADIVAAGGTQKYVAYLVH